MIYQIWTVSIVREKYANGGTVINLIADKDGINQMKGEPIATATTWIPGLSAEEVAIKDYSENVGMLDFVVGNNIVYPPHRWSDDFAQMAICKVRPVKDEYNG